VEYCSAFYVDADLFDGKWFFEDSQGDLQTFMLQHLVKPLNEPTNQRRDPPDASEQT